MQMVDQISRNESIKGSDHTSKWNFLFDSMVFTYFKPNHRSNAYTHTHDKKKRWKTKREANHHIRLMNKSCCAECTERENIWNLRLQLQQQQSTTNNNNSYNNWMACHLSEPNTQNTKRNWKIKKRNEHDKEKRSTKMNRMWTEKESIK